MKQGVFLLFFFFLRSLGKVAPHSLWLSDSSKSFRLFKVEKKTDEKNFNIKAGNTLSEITMTAGRHQCMNCQAIFLFFFFFLKKLSASTAARTGAGFWDWQRGKMIAGWVQWALGLFPPIVLRNPYVNSTLYWKYRMKLPPPPPTPNCVLRNPQPHCLQLTVDFMSGTSISPLALFWLLVEVPVLE